MQPRLFDPDREQLRDDETALTVAGVISLYLRHAAVDGAHSQAAREERERILPAFAAAMGNMLVADAKSFHLSEWVESNPKWKSTSTRRAKANQVRAAFNWAFQTERIERHPFRNVRYAEAEPRQPMPDETLNLFTHYANKKFEVALRFLRLTGCRLAELCNAHWVDMDLVRGEWTIHKHKSRRYTRKPKRVALVGPAIELLKRIDRDSDSVFLNSHGRPWTPGAMGILFRWLKKRHKIDTPASLHGIRHAAASAMLGAGAPIKLVAEQLGHSRTDILEETYYHRSDSHLAAMKAAVEMGLPEQP